MRILLSTYGSRGDIEPIVALAVELRALGAEVRVASVDDFVAGYIAATYDTLAAAAKGCDVFVASGMLHFVAQSVADKVGIPHRFVVFCPSLLGAQGWHALVDAPLNAHREPIDGFGWIVSSGFTSYSAHFHTQATNTADR